MKKMIMHIATKKTNKVLKAMGLEGISKDDTIGAGLCLVWMVSMLFMTWLFTN